MNKADLANAVADKTGMSRSAANQAVEAVVGVIGETLQKGEEVRVLGFGNFVVTRRAASTGRNPQTGAPMQIKASNQAKFKPGKGLKDSLNS